MWFVWIFSCKAGLSRGGCGWVAGGGGGGGGVALAFGSSNRALAVQTNLFFFQGCSTFVP